MIKAASYLKPAWVRHQIELALPLLPIDSSVALWLGGRKLVDAGAAAPGLSEQTPGVQSFALTIDGQRVGVLLVVVPPGAEALARHWGEAQAHSCQGVLDAERGRRAVAQETLESYRDMAQLQRATRKFNHSLKPATVAALLLEEFSERGQPADYGAVFLGSGGDADLEVIQSFGAGAAARFSALRHSGLLQALAQREVGDIDNDLWLSPSGREAVVDCRSLLWLPLVANGKKLGLLLLLRQRSDGFAAGDMKRAETLCAIAATALHNAQLYTAEQDMFRSFVRVLATAIDAKSPCTAGHCRRVPELALMLAAAAHDDVSGPLADFVLDEEKKTALEIAAMLHDCGKVVIPEWIVDKATKLDGLINRIDLIALRFELMRREVALESRRLVDQGTSPAVAEQGYQERLRRIADDFAFLEKCNLGSEFVSAEDIQRIRDIAAITWRSASGEEFGLLTDNEAYNLSIQRGTLNPLEREIIEGHAVHTINMLSQISFPPSLQNVKEYAAGHHERMDGSGYPRGLKREQLSIPARILAIADIFEALTAPDRPYRKGGSLSWAIEIMQRMKRDNHIDGDLFDLFLATGIHARYAQKYLVDDQADRATANASEAAGIH